PHYRQFLAEPVLILLTLPLTLATAGLKPLTTDSFQAIVRADSIWLLQQREDGLCGAQIETACFRKAQAFVQRFGGVLEKTVQGFWRRQAAFRRLTIRHGPDLCLPPDRHLQ